MPIDLWLPPKPAIIRPASLREQMFTFPTTFFAGATATRSVEGTFSSSSGGTTSFTSGSIALGTASGTSLVAVAVATAAGAGIAGTALSTVSIDGTNGTIHSNVVFGADTTVKVMGAIASRATSSTSGVISVTYSQNVTNVWIQVYRLNNLTSTTPDDTDTNSGDGLSSVSVTASITGIGVILAAATTTGTTANDASFSAGVATDFAASASNRHGADGSQQNVSSGNVTVTAIPPSGIATARMCIATANWH